MVRSVIVGSGISIPPNRVTNAMLARIMDAGDEWIRDRSGVETRYYVDEGTATSDLGVAAARAALENAGVDRGELDLIIFATMTPDHFFPGCGGILQAKLGAPRVPCFDIRQQCAGFLYGMQLADAQIRSGMAGTVLLVGAETHTGFMPWTPENYRYLYGLTETPPTAEEYAWNTRFRNVTVLFGDAGGAVVLKASEEEGRGVIDAVLHTDGTDYDRIYVPGAGFRHRPYVDPAQIARGDHIPVMKGTYVFRHAANSMTRVAMEILERNGITMDDVALVLMHQANLRINERVQKMLGIPDAKVIHNIQRYGNTTAATIPLLWDEAARTGRIRSGDLVMMVAFGAGMNWGALLLRV
ncbi:MAG: beta-ketoacyl-ACP synthase III [Acidobacteriota bacterium]|nr:beta-ketoacyl-ACP synthase III [Acidobacteriota bacterium]NLT32539.1 ketoacyl-ACP synthase III [Acidobacteriota bacterium]